MSRPPPPSGSAKAPAERFRTQIEAAIAQGARVEEMRLHLTLNDASRLMRDRSIPVEAIAYSGGVMTYLGVQVDRGGVDASRLDLPDGAT